MAEVESQRPKTEMEKRDLRIKALESKLESLGVKGDAKLFYSLNKTGSIIFKSRSM